MEKDSLQREASESEAFSASRRSMVRTVRHHAEEMLEELRRRSWGSEAASTGIDFLELMATHSRPPSHLRPFCDAMAMALSSHHSDVGRADQIRNAATLLSRCARRGSWTQAAALVLREYAASLDARPEARMELIQLCMKEMGSGPVSTEKAIPRLEALTKTDATNVELSKLISLQTTALCMSALHEACTASPYADWSMQDIQGALFALRYHYVNASTTLCGEPVMASERQEDFRDVGQPLWEALRKAALLLSARDRCYSRHLEDDLWHQQTQAAIFLAISAERTKPVMEFVQKENASPLFKKAPVRVVCRTPIVPSTDQHDQEEIERHRILERPLPLALMPCRAEIETSQRRLTSEFPWAKDVLHPVFDDLLGRVAVGASILSMPPTLLVGHPGSGKSRLARRLAEEFRLPRLDLCLGGSSDSKMLSGTSRGWGSGKPCDLATLLATNQSASAIVILDELDKSYDQQRGGGGIQAYLLGLVEPETAARHHDVFLKAECDLSGVLWMATANRLSGIAPALLTRLRVLMLQQPGSDHFPVIAQNVIVDVAKSWGVDRQILPELCDLDLPLDRLASARQVRLATERAITSWARQLQRH